MYKFPLQKLGEYRKRQEEIYQKDLSECNRNINHEAKKLKNLNTSKKKAYRKIQEIQKESFTTSDNLLFGYYLENLEKKINDENNKIYNLELQKDNITDKLLEAVKKRKMIDKLKEYGLEKHRKEMNKRVQYQLDESGAYRFGRKLMSNP